LLEAAALAGAGGLLGLVIGIGAGGLLTLLVPALPVRPSLEHALLAEAVAIAIGVGAGSLPAVRAAGLNPVEALRAD
jgi:putative ABC transport system permease protein